MSIIKDSYVEEFIDDDDDGCIRTYYMRREFTRASYIPYIHLDTYRIENTHMYVVFEQKLIS